MSAGRGHEMRKYLISVSILVVLIIVALVAYNTVVSIQRIDDDMETEKQRVVEQLVDYFNTTMEKVVAVSGGGQEMEEIFNPALTESNDPAAQLKLLQALADIQRATYAADYLVYVSGGMVLVSSVEEGLDIDDFPTRMAEGDYEILDELGGREGTFISVYSEAELSPLQDEFVNFAVDRTEQMQAIDDFYSDKRSDLITRQVVVGVVAVAIALLLTTLGVYFLTRRYITGPIEELAEASHRMMEGTFEGEVEIVEESDYADIQRLLKSGKVLIDRMSDLEEG